MCPRISAIGPSFPDVGLGIFLEGLASQKHALKHQYGVAASESPPLASFAREKKTRQASQNDRKSVADSIRDAIGTMSRLPILKITMA